MRHLDFVPIEDFNGYLGACDIVLNLRYPTVGESSGTLQRALGMGKAVIVSDVGSFRELPDEICLKAPVDATEEEHLFEYLNLLVTRPRSAARWAIGRGQWVERECSWEVGRAALCGVSGSRGRRTEWKPRKRVRRRPQRSPRARRGSGRVHRLLGSAEDGSRAYVETHRTRLERTLALTPPGGPEDRILEMGAYLQITPALKTRLGYGEVRGCYYGAAGRDRSSQRHFGKRRRLPVRHRSVRRRKGPFSLRRWVFLDRAVLRTDRASALRSHAHDERDQPHPEARRNAGADHAEHRFRARGVRDSARLSSHAVSRLTSVPNPAGETEARHNREYSPREVKDLLENSGFEVAALETGPFRDEPKPEHAWVEHLLDRYILSEGESRRRDLRGGPQASRRARSLSGVVVCCEHGVSGLRR